MFLLPHGFNRVELTSFSTSDGAKWKYGYTSTLVYLWLGWLKSLPPWAGLMTVCWPAL